MYVYEKYNFRVISLLTALLCIPLIIRGEYLLALIPGLIAIFTSISKTGIHIDKDKKRYRKYDSFSGIYFGRWKTLPQPEYVTLVRVILSNQRKQPTPVIVPEHTGGVRSYRVNLVVDDEDRYIPVCRGSREDMTREALKLGRILDIRVLDYSTSEKKWIL